MKRQGDSGRQNQITDDQADSTQTHTGKEIVDPEIPTNVSTRGTGFSRFNKNIGMKTNAAYAILMGTILCFVVALVMELAPWPAGFQAFKPSWLILVLLYWTLTNSIE